MILSFFVPGIPAPQGSKRHVGHGVLIESSKAVGPWRSTVSLYAYTAVQSHKSWTVRDQKQPMRVSLAFRFPRPKSVKKDRLHVVTPDGDKLERACWDALKNIVWGDDSQVVSWSGTKDYCETGQPPGVLIIVEEIV